jgi:hypothetical protein
VRVLSGYSVSENSHTIPELKTVIQSQISIIETIHTKTLSNFLSSFVRLHEVCDFWGHHMTTRFQSIITELSPSREATSRAATQELPALNGTRTFITVFKIALHWFLS